MKFSEALHETQPHQGQLVKRRRRNFHRNALTIFSAAVLSINLEPWPGGPLQVTFTPKRTDHESVSQAMLYYD